VPPKAVEDASKRDTADSGVEPLAVVPANEHQAASTQAKG